MLDTGSFEISVSVPLVLEYESAAKRICDSVGLAAEDVDDIIDYICKVAEHREIFYLWRPFLRDPMDDMVLEVAVESAVDYLVTHNVRHFRGAETLGVNVVAPQRFLGELGGLR